MIEMHANFIIVNWTLLCYSNHSLHSLNVNAYLRFKAFVSFDQSKLSMRIHAEIFHSMHYSSFEIASVKSSVVIHQLINRHSYSIDCCQKLLQSNIWLHLNFVFVCKIQLNFLIILSCYFALQSNEVSYFYNDLIRKNGEIIFHLLRLVLLLWYWCLLSSVGGEVVCL